MIEAGARKSKQGALVREGLLIEGVSFRYDVKRYGKTHERLAKTAQFTVPGGGAASEAAADPGPVRLPVVGDRGG